MWVILVVAGIAGAAYFFRRKPKVVKVKEVAPVLTTVSEVAEKLAPKMPTESLGDNFIHNETGQRVKIVKVPSAVDGGEYAIEWPSGAIGYIHEAQLKSWFTEI